MSIRPTRRCQHVLASSKASVPVRPGTLRVPEIRTKPWNSWPGSGALAVGEEAEQPCRGGVLWTSLVLPVTACSSPFPSSVSPRVCPAVPGRAGGCRLLSDSSRADQQRWLRPGKVPETQDLCAPAPGVRICVFTRSQAVPVPLTVGEAPPPPTDHKTPPGFCSPAPARQGLPPAAGTWGRWATGERGAQLAGTRRGLLRRCGYSARGHVGSAGFWILEEI